MSKDKIALPENHAITKNLKLRITGVVRQYEVGKMDKELGWRPPGEIEVKFRDKPVIIVEKVVMKDKPEIAWTAPR